MHQTPSTDLWPPSPHPLPPALFPWNSKRSFTQPWFSRHLLLDKLILEDPASSSPCPVYKKIDYDIIDHNNILTHFAIVSYSSWPPLINLVIFIVIVIFHWIHFSWIILSERGRCNEDNPMWSINLWDKARKQHQKLRALLFSTKVWVL